MAVRKPKIAIGPVGRPRKPAAAKTHRRIAERIRYKDAFGWTQAVRFATHVLAKPMTAFVTVQWSVATSSTPEPERVSSLLNLISIWLRRRTGGRAVWAYSREGGLKKGVHLHLLAHVPPIMFDDFAVAVARWVEASSDTFARRAVDVQRIHPPTLDNLLSYFLKEGDDEVHDRLGVRQDHRADRRGYPVPGKRLRVSHAIDVAARSRHAKPLASVLDTQERH
ncbi:hypothetical protein [Brevundimonas sp. TWP2-3-4b2]|uniref:hypothetical protein n=1 Tax=Brevundimonas sp. TWP2-3-4b2 TaxID=2804595 RepID=UPI003CE929BD